MNVSFDFESLLTMKTAQKDSLGNTAVLLLEKIHETGSITKGAKAAGISYKTAWDTIDRINSLTDSPVVESISGGSGGGGSRLTEKGQHLVFMFRMIETEQRKVLSHLQNSFTDFEESLRLFRRVLLKTSARNMFYGIVKSICPGKVSSEITLALKGGDLLSASITNHSLEYLELKAGDEACGLVKASYVFLAEPGVITSARNSYTGIVEKVFLDEISAEVVIRLPGGNQLAATITAESIKKLDIREGSQTCAMFKSSSVILGRF